MRERDRKLVALKRALRAIGPMSGANERTR
jgi:hypothetical protein